MRLRLADRRRVYTLPARRPIASIERNPHGYRPVASVEEFDLPVYGTAPGASREAVQAGRDTSRIAWTLYCPPGIDLDGSEEVHVDGDWHEVNGASLDWTNGPWDNPVAGVVVELLKRRG